MSAMRPYQEEAINQISTEYGNGVRKVLLHLATGGGKTHIFSDVLKRTAAKGNKCIMVVRGRQLVDQASQRLFHEGVEHGVRMASHWNKNYGAKVQLCSIDTLLSRNEFPEATLVVIDEAHLFTSERCKQFINHYSDVFILSVTATPYSKESLTHLADTVIHPVGVQDLIDQGYLVPPRYFAPSTPDLKGVHSRNGDYVAEELQERMSILTGDIPSHWLKLSEGRPTLCFAVNIKHSEAIVESFKKAGIPAEHIEGDHTFEQRKAAIQRLQSGHIKVLSNVGVLCTGVDIPFASCILMARPTKSYSLYIQQAGRGTRICPETEKQDFLILDHAGNVLRHGFIQDEPEVHLEGWIKEPRGGPVTMCEACFLMFNEPECPACGWSKPVPAQTERTIEVESGVLKELKGLPQAVEISLYIKRLKDIQKRKGYKKGWIYHAIVEKYGEAIAQMACPKRSVPWFVKR